MRGRFLLQSGREPGTWVCADRQLGIEVRWTGGRFNDTQVVTPLSYTAAGADALALARAMREMAEWLQINHKDKV